MKKRSFLNLKFLIVFLLVAAIAIPISLQVFSAEEPWKFSNTATIVWVETADSKVSDEALEKQIQLFDSELAAKMGQSSALPIVYGASSKAEKGDILVVLDKSLGIAKQGFRITLSGGILTVSASDADGLFYGCRDVIQQLLLNSKVTAKEDAPDVLERAVSLDNGRKYFSVENIKTLIREMSWCKMNALALHFSEEMGLGIESKTYPWLAGRDGTLCVAAEIATDNTVLTHEEIAEIVEYAKLYHVEIIPSFDSPGHMNYVVKKFNEKCASSKFSFTYDGKTYTAKQGSKIGNYFHYNNKTSIVQGSRNKSYSRGIDISNDVAVAFTKSLITEYATLFGNLGCTKFDIGGDELLGWGTAVVSTSTASRWQQLDHWKTYAQNRAKAEGKSNYSSAVAYDAFLYYMNDLNDLVRGLGYTSVRMWNDDAMRSNDTGWNKVVNLDTNIDIWYWTASANNSKNSVWTYANPGYEVYNILSDYNYYVMNDDYYDDRSDGFDQAYADQIYNEWNPYIFDPTSTAQSGKNTAIGNTSVLGSGFGIWCDNPSMKTDAKVIEEALILIRAHAAKAWDSECNKSVNYSTFTSQLTKLGSAPTNLPAAPAVTLLELKALNEAVAVFESVSANAYTQESYNAYKQAVQYAQTLAYADGTTQAQLNEAVANISKVKTLLRTACEVSDKTMIISVTSRSTYVLQGQTVTLSVVANERINSVQIYDETGRSISVNQFAHAATSSDTQDTVALQFVESTPGTHTYYVYAIDSEGKRSADYMECSVICY